MKIAGKIIIPCLLLLSFFLTPLSVSLQIPQENLALETHTQQVELSLHMNEAHAQTGQGLLYEDCGEFYNIGCHLKNAYLHLYELIIYNLTQILAALTGFMLDFVLSFSISAETYRSGIIEAGWEILRDFTNIIFIFALLIIAFNLVLGNDKANVKNLLMKTILVALVVNFSLFVTYVVIDASNLLAHSFYDRINVQGDYSIAKISTDSDGFSDNLNRYFQEHQTKTVSLAIISQFNPQRLLSGQNFSFIEKMFLILIAGIVNLFLVYIFTLITLLFLGRTIGLMLLGIFAPVAFGTLTLPKATEIEWIGFNTWWKQLLTLAFTAPIFLFLLYLTVMFASNDGIIGAMQTAQGSNSVIGGILNVILPFGIVAVLLLTSLKVTQKLAGKLGAIIADAATKSLAGTAAAAAIVATGGAAVAGAGLRGAGAGLRAAGTVAGDTKVGAFLSKTGSSASKLGKTAMAFKADVTKIPGFKSIAGKDINNVASKILGKSALGHADNIRAKSKKSWEIINEKEALDTANEKRLQKKAQSDAKKAGEEVRQEKDAEIYQQKIEWERTKNSQKYINATNELNKSIQDLTQAQDEEKQAQEFYTNVQNNPYGYSAAEKQQASDNLKTARDKRSQIQADLTTKQQVIANMTPDIEGMREERDELIKQAESKSRIESAQRIVNKTGNTTLANKIIEKKDPKNKTIEKLEKMLEDDDKKAA